jgi:NADH:ubiquinone oxidoreductase subunit 6 (subunit J)
MRGEFEDARYFGLFAFGFWFLWGVASIVIWRSPIELVREVAIVVYPLGAILSLVLSVYFGYEMRDLIAERELVPQREIWTFVLGGILIAVVMVIRCFDIQWLRSSEELKPEVARPDLDEDYGKLH